MRHSHLFTPFFSSGSAAVSALAHSLVSSISQQKKRREGGEDEVVVGMRFPLHFIESAGIAIDENREPRQRKW